MRTLGTGARRHRAANRRGGGRIVWIAMLGLLLAGGSLAAQKTPWPNIGEDPSVTPVTGVSWLKHLGLEVAGTRLGQGSSHYGPSDEQRSAAASEPLGVRRTMAVTMSRSRSRPCSCS